jgi:hypothetical protein
MKIRFLIIMLFTNSEIIFGMSGYSRRILPQAGIAAQRATAAATRAPVRGLQITRPIDSSIEEYKTIRAMDEKIRSDARDKAKLAVFLDQKSKRNPSNKVLKEEAEKARIEAEMALDALLKRLSEGIALMNQLGKEVLSTMQPYSPVEESWRAWLTRRWQELIGNKPR